MKDKIEIKVAYDSWSIYVHNRRFDFDHEDEDYGSTSIKNLLEHLGYKVSVEEVS